MLQDKQWKLAVRTLEMDNNSQGILWTMEELVSVAVSAKTYTPAILTWKV